MLFSEVHFPPDFEVNLHEKTSTSMPAYAFTLANGRSVIGNHIKELSSPNLAFIYI